MGKPQAFLAGVGDVNDPITWSGTPYHFLQAARAGNLFDVGLPLATEGRVWRTRRLAWNGWRWLTGRGKGGYQYSVSFLEELWKPFVDRLADQIVVNCFQLYPPSMVQNRRIRKYYYIDMTLVQLFDFYQERSTIGRAIAREAMEREKEGYQAAETVVCFSNWAAQSVIGQYQVEPGKVKVVLPGANIDRDTYYKWDGQVRQSRRPRKPDDPLQLIFVGKYWKRKGLDRLLEAIILAQKQGVHAHLKIMGCPQSDLPQHLQHVPDVQWLGFINKRHELPKFLDVVSQADIGCLLSRAEAGGMAMREYHACGLAVMGPKVDGAVEGMLPGTGRAFGPTETPEAIAQWLVELNRNPEQFMTLRENAWNQRHEALWDTTVKGFRAFWPLNN